MSFKEIFDRYRNGTATEEEVMLVNEELEKNELISEYLSERYSEEVQKLEMDDVSIPAKKIKSSIRKKFMLVSLVSATVACILVLSICFIISPLIDAANYNPNKGYQSESVGQSRFFVDMSVYAELHFPGYTVSHAGAQPQGFGKYDIEIAMTELFDRNVTEQYNAHISKGKLERMPQSFYKFPDMNAFSHGVYPFEQIPADAKQSDIHELSRLPETACAKTFVSLKDDIGLKDLNKLIEENSNLNFIWAAVRCVDKQTQLLPQCGFVPMKVGYVIPKEAYDEGKYPCLEMAYSHNSETRALSPDIYEKHFISTLKYMNDKKDFAKLFHISEFYSSALEYVKKNGIWSYGVFVQGRCKDVIKLANDQRVDKILIDDVKLSEYSK